MCIKNGRKFVSVVILLSFLVTNVSYSYAAPDSRSIFKNKKVDYQKLSTQKEEHLQKTRSVFGGEDPNQAGAQKKEAKRILQAHLEDLSQIHIPAELGRVIEVYQAPSSEAKLVVNIQDLHTNPEGQYNLAGILEILLMTYDMGLVCSEGADGVIDTSSISSFPDSEIREKVAKLFVNSGELTGEEYLSITKYPTLPIWGIEDRDIYFQNIVQFNRIMKFNPDSQLFISQVKKALEELRPMVYSKELLSIGQKEAEYETQKIETADYLKHLAGYIQRFDIPVASYKNIALLNDTIIQENTIDQQKIMQETQNILLNLQTAISSKNSRSEMDSLMARVQLFKEQKISPFSFYSYLKELADRHLKEGIAKYSNINNFLDYLTKVNSLDSTKLFIEMEALTFDIKQRLAKNDEERLLTQALRNIKFLEGFFNLKVSNEELDYYLNNRDSHKVAFFESFLKPAIKKYNIAFYIDYNPRLIDIHLQEIEDFYRVVKERDVAMFRNSISEVEKRDAKVAALISGGFHTKGITRLLKEKGYSYVVVSPYSKTEIDEENYHFLLSGKRRSVSELLKELDFTEIAKDLNAALRVVLAFDPDLAQAYNQGPGRELGIEIDDIALNVSAILAAYGLREIKRWKNPVWDMGIRKNETTGDIVFSIRAKQQWRKKTTYIKITPAGNAALIEEAEFNTAKKEMADFRRERGKVVDRKQIDYERFSRAFPMEFLNMFLNNTDISYPDGFYNRDLSINARILLALPALIEARMRELGIDIRGLGFMYGLAYFGRLSEKDRGKVAADLAAANENDLADWLKTYTNKSLDEQVDAINEKVGIVDKEQFKNFVTTHDVIVARSRELRIGAVETNDASVSFDVLRAMVNCEGLRQVVLGLKPAAVIRDDYIKGHVKEVREALWALHQSQMPIINMLELPDGRIYVYDEYLLQETAVRAGLDFSETKSNLEFLINIDMARNEGVFVEALNAEVDNSMDRLGSSIAGEILLQEQDRRFSVWDNKEKIFRASNLGARVFELEKPAAEAVYIGTDNRPIALRKQIEAEVENARIFNCAVDICIIDGSTGDNLDKNAAMLREFTKRYGARFVHLTPKEFYDDMGIYADSLYKTWQEALGAGRLSKDVIEVLSAPRPYMKDGAQRDGIMLKDGKLVKEEILHYLFMNTFFHISGLRNYTFLQAKGDKVIMIFDDDAPRETFVLFKGKRDSIRQERLARRNALMSGMIKEVGQRLGMSISSEAELYRALAYDGNRDKVKDIERKYFGYDMNENIGLIPQAMEEIMPASSQYLDQDGMANELGITHLRYQSLMDPSPYMLRVSDFIYQRPRAEKNDNAFKVMPVNVMAAARLVGKKASDTHLPVMKKDLRGILAHPVTEGERAEIGETKISYVAYPFINDQDTSGIAQFMRYVQTGNKVRTNLQHTDQSALILEGVRGFVGDTYVICNRAALENVLPVPSIGTDLRLEEPPLRKWVGKLVENNTTSMAYAPAAGGQIREIGERMYVISYQDFTEVVGGVARGFYEKAVRDFNAKLERSEDLQRDDNWRERSFVLGKCYMDVAGQFSLSEEQISGVLRQRDIRAMLISDLGTQRFEKMKELERASGENKTNLEQQIRDMDLIMLQYADDFSLYRIKDRKGAKDRKADYGPKDPQNDYFYRVRKEGGKLYWQAVYPDINVEKIRGLTYTSDVATESGWRDAPDKNGVMDLAGWRSGQALEIEPGRRIIFKDLPQDNQEAIAAGISDILGQEFIDKVARKASNQVMHDGETILLWPYILQDAKNWREYRTDKIVKAEDDATLASNDAIGASGFDYKEELKIESVMRRHNRGVFNFLKATSDIIEGKRRENGFDYMVLVPMTGSEEEELQERFDSGKLKGVLAGKTEVVSLGSQVVWKGKAGNGMGTLLIIEELDKRFRNMGTSLREELSKGKSIAIIHTAGDATRIAISRTRNNKCLLNITPKMNITDAAIKQMQALAMPGKVFVTWGDQVILPSEENLHVKLAKLNGQFKTLLFGIDYPESMFTPADARQFGWQIVNADKNLIAFDDTRDYDFIIKSLERIKNSDPDKKDLKLRWNMGAFAIDGDVIDVIFQAFRGELVERKGMFNSDEIWQAWVSQDKESYVQVYSKGDSAKKAHAEWLYGRAHYAKERLGRKFGLGQLIGTVGLGVKGLAYGYDFGTDTSYSRSLRLALEFSPMGLALREFLQLGKQTVVTPAFEIVDSIFESSGVKNGRIDKSYVESSRIEKAKCSEAIIQQSRLKNASVFGGTVFNVVDHDYIEVDRDELIFDVFHPVEGRIRMKMKYGEDGDVALTPKDIWWKTRIHDNPYSLEELSVLMKDVSREDIEITKARITQMVEYIINNNSSLVGIGSALGITKEEIKMLNKMADRHDELAAFVLDSLSEDTLASGENLTNLSGKISAHRAVNVMRCN